MTPDQKYKINQITGTFSRYMILKNSLLEKLKNTVLYPYVLNMTYLVGTIDGVKVSEDPLEKLGPYLQIQNGINEKLKISFTREELNNWEVFSLIKHIGKEDFIKELEIYLILNIKHNSLNFLIFSIIDDKIIEQERTCILLDNDERIIETKNKMRGVK